MCLVPEGLIPLAKLAVAGVIGHRAGSADSYVGKRRHVRYEWREPMEMLVDGQVVYEREGQ